MTLSLCGDQYGPWACGKMFDVQEQDVEDDVHVFRGSFLRMPHPSVISNGLSARWDEGIALGPQIYFRAHTTRFLAQANPPSTTCTYT